MTNVINSGAWAGVYAAGIYGTGRVIGGAVGLVSNTGKWAWDSLSKRSIAAFPEKGHESKNEFLNGAMWFGIALLAKQVVARVLSPVAPANIVSAFSALGWNAVRSPAIDTAVSKINTLFALNLTLY